MSSTRVGKYLICRSDKGTNAEWILGSVARNKNPANPIRNCRKHIFRLDEKPGRERSITSCDPIPGIFPASFLRKQFRAQPTKNGNRAQETGSSEWEREREKHFGKNINLFSCLWKELIPDSISHASDIVVVSRDGSAEWVDQGFPGTGFHPNLT